MATIAAASTAAAAAAAGLYLNHKLGITKDVDTIRNEKLFSQNLTTRIAQLGDQVHLYRMLELANPNADAIWFEGRTWSYAAMKTEVDLIATGLSSLGVKNGDFVAVFMTNSPEMVFTVYALTKLGAAPALINSALRDDTLLHCVRLPHANLIMSTPDLAPFAAQAASALSSSTSPIKTVCLDLGSFRTQPRPFSPASSNDSNSILPFPYPSAAAPISTTATTTNTTTISSPPKTVASVGALIYTSGTTGKPKACRIKNMLILVVSTPTALDTRDGHQKYLSGLRTYSCMPLFHGTTFFTGLCYSVGTSSCFCVSRKFSARGFWREVSMSRATRVLYVGELCRFLLSTPAGPFDKDHSVTVAAGNGLAKDVWLAFQRKFDVSEIREFYRSTEGVVKFDNRLRIGRDAESGAGKVGFNGLVKRRRETEQCILRFDYDSEQPVRGTDGWCVKADVGEPGEAIGRIRNVQTYIDYHDNEEANEKKVLRDVFEKGDLWQRSGDLLVVENSGWVRFVDRIGDTYRWKGENVSAGEVKGFIAELPGVDDCVVVGRKLAGYDGQAGVAGITLESGKDEREFMASLFTNLQRKGVPSYAFPRLVQVMEEIKVGDTFKHAKQLVKAIVWGDNGSAGGQYFLDVEAGKYVPLDTFGWKAIESGKAKL